LHHTNSNFESVLLIEINSVFSNCDLILNTTLLNCASNGFALARLCRGIESAQFNFGFADGWHEGCEPGGLHKSHYLQSRPIAVSRFA
jgi:hypothetical protein